MQSACNKSVCGDKYKWEAYVKCNCPKQERISKVELNFFCLSVSVEQQHLCIRLDLLTKKLQKRFKRLLTKR